MKWWTQRINIGFCLCLYIIFFIHEIINNKDYHDILYTYEAMSTSLYKETNIL